MDVSAINNVNFNGVKRVKKFVQYMHKDTLTCEATETVIKKTGFSFVLGTIQNSFNKIKNNIAKFFGKKENASSFDATIVSKQLVVPPINFHTRIYGQEVDIPIHHKHVIGQFELDDGTKVAYKSVRPDITSVDIKDTSDGSPVTLRVYGGEQGMTPEEIKYLLDGPIKDLRKQIDSGELKSNIDVAALFKK